MHKVHRAQSQSGWFIRDPNCFDAGLLVYTYTATGCARRMPFISVNSERKNFCNGLAIDKYKIRLPFSPLAGREAWWRSRVSIYSDAVLQENKLILWVFCVQHHDSDLKFCVYLRWLLWPSHRAYVVVSQCRSTGNNNSIDFTFKAKKHRYLVYWQWELNVEWWYLRWKRVFKCTFGGGIYLFR